MNWRRKGFDFTLIGEVSEISRSKKKLTPGSRKDRQARSKPRVGGGGGAAPCYVSSVNGGERRVKRW